MGRAAIPSFRKGIVLPGLIVANDGEVSSRPSCAPRKNWFGAHRTGIALSLALHLVLLALLVMRPRTTPEVPLPPENFIVMELVSPAAGAAAARSDAQQQAVPAAASPSKPQPQAESRKPLARKLPEQPRVQPTQAAPSPAIAPAPAEAPQTASPASAAASVSPDLAPAQSGPRGGGTGAQFPLEYLRALAQVLNFRTVYPASAKRDGARGTAIVRMRLARDGTVLSASLLRKTGYPLLDKEALGVIRRIAKFPPLSNEYLPGEQEFTIDQPVGFGER